MDIEKLLGLMVEKGASDLFITAGVPPSVKINGRVVPAARSSRAAVRGGVVVGEAAS